MFGKFRNLHFVGIGGAGMSGIAEILHNLGFKVTGSDSVPSNVTAYLADVGVRVDSSHAGDNVEGADVVIISSAVADDNPEVVRAREIGIPVIKRAEMLGELMRLKYSIGVAGTHGKTTTTSMLGRILQHAQLQPTLIVGGIVAELGTGAALGDGEYLVAEADEYDRSFEAMFPTMAVVTNIEADHLDCYDDMDDLLNSFLSFINRVPFYGSAVLNLDDQNIEKMLSKISRPHVTFGINSAADYRAVDIKHSGAQNIFSVFHHEELLGEIILNVPGKYNISNALAAIASATELDVPFSTIASALLNFKGVARRFEKIGSANDVVVYDDYAHHPTEVRATLEMLKDSFDRRVIVVFQPHLFSRTQEFAQQFASALALADICILTDIYPAREKPIPGVTSEMIIDFANQNGDKNFNYVGTKDKALPYLLKIAKPGDLIITMGAGSITHIRHDILEGLESK